MSGTSPESPQERPGHNTGVIPAGKSLSGDAGGSESASSSDGTTRPVERLRLAADLVEQRAAAASGPRWEPEYSYGRTWVQAIFVECDGEDCEHDRYGRVDGTCAIGAMHDDADNRWAILLSPQVAAPLAAWLRAEAAVCERWERDAVGGAGGPIPTGPLAVAEALALADVLLGEDRS